MTSFCFRCLFVFATAIAMMSCVAYRSAEDMALASLVELMGQSAHDVERRWHCADVDRWGWSQGDGSIDRAVRLDQLAGEKIRFSQLVVSFQSNTVVCADAQLFPCTEYGFKMAQWRTISGLDADYWDNH